ncbi:MAG: hypothetical protein Q8R50_12955 [Sediminibacterium sp.]|nr:hypothetical protein [Sediminibacterium sp.]
MYRKLLLVGCMVLLFLTGNVQAQQIDSLLGVYEVKVPQEKIHIHFDNSQYMPGQTVWFKAYLLHGNEPSELSRNLYIDWFTEQGKLLDRTIAPVAGSCAVGNFVVPEKYTGSRLRVLAYTKWMLNFDSAFLFHQTLQVAQTSAIITGLPAILPATTLRFFPEGGELVENISGVIAFKATNSEGLPVNIQGTINNSIKQVVADFFTEHDGMGKIIFKPLPGEIYTAEWKDPQENTQYTPLPSAKKTGLVLSINNTPANRRLIIERLPLLEDRYKRITIVATMNQQVVFRAAAKLTDKNSITASLPTTDFPSGVLRLTVFDNYRQPVAERILFINNQEYRLAAELLMDTVNLEKRGKNTFHLALADTIPATLSLSITDGEGNYDSSQNIISRLLLSSEIKGHIHNPAYYFASEEDSVSRHLDLVMLTNGWRRFKWDEVLTGKTPVLKYAHDSGYLTIEGKIDNLSDKKIKKAELVNLILMAKDSTKQFIFTALQADGSFREENMILFDTTKVFYQLNKTFIPARSHVGINTTFLPFDSTKTITALAKFLADTTGITRIKAIAREQRRLEELMKAVTLKEVVVKTRIKTRLEEMNDTYARGVFESGQSRNFNIADDPQGGVTLTAFAYLVSRVPGLQINDPYSLNPSAIWRREQVSLFLDEMPVDAPTLASVPISNIAYIKVFNPPFFGAPGGGSGGAIAVYLRKGNDTKGIFTGLDYTLLPGYSPIKEFYSPNYAEQQLNFSPTDLRRTLFWKPNIQLDGTNKQLILSFYNNDISHSLQLVVEGLTQDGRLIQVSKLLKQ